MDTANDKLTADEIVNRWSEKEIADLLYREADEHDSRRDRQGRSYERDPYGIPRHLATTVAGVREETARVPPSLDSPLSAAPETFLLRDACRLCLPLAFGAPATVVAKCAVSVGVALVRSPWRSFWNRAHPLPGRAGRRFPSPTTDSQSRLPSSLSLAWSIRMSSGAPRETKTPARLDQAACSKPQVGQDPVPPSESPTLARPPHPRERRVHQRHFLPKVLRPLPRQLHAPCASRSRLINRPANQSLAIASECPPPPAWRPMYLPSGPYCAASRHPLPTGTGVCGASNLAEP